MIIYKTRMIVLNEIKNRALKKRLKEQKTLVNRVTSKRIISLKLSNLMLIKRLT